jgi:hypothetical protein
MRAGLVGYFDLGSSAGLSDAALREDLREPLPDIGMVGLLNPLGQGTVVDLLGSQILSAWRQGAVAQISRPEMELGWREEWSAPGQFVLDSTSTANPSGSRRPQLRIGPADRCGRRRCVIAIPGWSRSGRRWRRARPGLGSRLAAAVRAPRTSSRARRAPLRAGTGLRLGLR